MLLSKNKKNNVYPFNPQFYYIKVGFKGVKITQACFRDGIWGEGVDLYLGMKDRVIPFSVATFANEENATYQGLVFVYVSSCSATHQPLRVISCRRPGKWRTGTASREE